MRVRCELSVFLLLQVAASKLLRSHVESAPVAVPDEHRTLARSNHKRRIAALVDLYLQNKNREQSRKKSKMITPPALMVGEPSLEGTKSPNLDATFS